MAIFYHGTSDAGVFRRSVKKLTDVNARSIACAVHNDTQFVVYMNRATNTLLYTALDKDGQQVRPEAPVAAPTAAIARLAMAEIDGTLHLVYAKESDGTLAWLQWDDSTNGFLPSSTILATQIKPDWDPDLFVFKNRVWLFYTRGELIRYMSAPLPFKGGFTPEASVYPQEGLGVRSGSTAAAYQGRIVVLALRKDDGRPWDGSLVLLEHDIEVRPDGLREYWSESRAITAAKADPDYAPMQLFQNPFGPAVAAVHNGLLHVAYATSEFNAGVATYDGVAFSADQRLFRQSGADATPENFAVGAHGQALRVFYNRA